MLLIKRDSLVHLDKYVKDLISSGQYSLYSNSGDKYIIQTSSADFFEITIDGKILKKLDSLPINIEPVYFDDTIRDFANLSMQNFFRSCC